MEYPRKYRINIYYRRYYHFFDKLKNNLLYALHQNKIPQVANFGSFGVKIICKAIY